jgi:hypothetical protein
MQGMIEDHPACCPRDDVRLMAIPVGDRVQFCDFFAMPAQSVRRIFRGPDIANGMDLRQTRASASTRCKADWRYRTDIMKELRPWPRSP